MQFLLDIYITPASLTLYSIIYIIHKIEINKNQPKLNPQTLNLKKKKIAQIPLILLLKTTHSKLN